MCVWCECVWCVCMWVCVCCVWVYKYVCVCVCAPQLLCCKVQCTVRILIKFRMSVVIKNRPDFVFLVLFNFWKQYGGRTNFWGSGPTKLPKDSNDSSCSTNNASNNKINCRNKFCSIQIAIMWQRRAKLSIMRFVERFSNFIFLKATFDNWKIGVSEIVTFVLAILRRGKPCTAWRTFVTRSFTCSPRFIFVRWRTAPTQNVFALPFCQFNDFFCLLDNLSV